MNYDFTSITEWIGAFIRRSGGLSKDVSNEADFNALAVSLCQLQLDSVPVYRRLCDRRRTGNRLQTWQDIPALPISAFKQADVTSLAHSRRSHSFYSSGTTSDERSVHYHDAASLALYETSLLAGFRRQTGSWPVRPRFLSLTPPRSESAHSSLVHMLDVLCRTIGGASSGFLGRADSRGNWTIERDVILRAVGGAVSDGIPIVLAGTAFSFVHLLDDLAARRQRLELPADSWLMETGGYKGRSRALSRDELYQRIHDLLGVPPARIVSEYGMCELSSQAYDNGAASKRVFRFSPWARFSVVSPEDGKVLPAGEPGILRVYDLANVRSVIAIQTEDLAVATADGFELLGRVTDSPPRGCSLMTA